MDSVADLSLFTRDDAELLGLKAKEGKFKPIIGVGRTLIPAYVHAVEMKIGDSSLKVQTAFADSDEIPRLLGRRDIFPKFTIIFVRKTLKSSSKKIRLNLQFFSCINFSGLHSTF